MPTTPPQERLPISRPNPASRNMAGKMSPSEAEFSSSSATLGPRKTPIGIHQRIVGGALELLRQGLAAQPLDEHARDVAAAVEAVVHNERFFLELRVVPLDELADAVGVHVRHVQVADAAVRQFVHHFPVAGYPVEIDELGFVGNRAIGDGARALLIGLSLTSNWTGLSAMLRKQPVGVVRAGQFLAVDGQNVIARFGVHADLGEGRAVNVLPRSALRRSSRCGSGWKPDRA